MTKKRIVLILLVVMAFSLITGCSSDNEEADVENQEENNQEIQDLDWSSEHYDEENMSGKTLNMYGVTDSIVPVLYQFTEDTGITVENLTMKNGEILQRLINEQDSGVVIADIWFTGGADTFISASQQGLLHAYKSPQGEVLDDKMKDPDGYWHGTSLTLVNWVVNIELVEEKNIDMPESWDDLLQEELKGEVSMSNPASSGTAYNTVSAMIEVRGEEEGWKYLEKLIEQVPFFTARGSDPANLVVNGEAIVGINASNGDRELEENNEHIKLVYPSDGTGWWPQPAAIVEGTENLEEAKVFIDWLLSKRGMETIANVRYAAVARDDVSIPEGIVDIKNINLFAVDFQANAENRDEILEKWTYLVE